MVPLQKLMAKLVNSSEPDTWWRMSNDSAVTTRHSCEHVAEPGLRKRQGGARAAQVLDAHMS